MIREMKAERVGKSEMSSSGINSRPIGCLQAGYRDWVQRRERS
jgi:hypothetical protein